MYKVEIEDRVEKVIFDEDSQQFVPRAQDLIDLDKLALVTAKENEIQEKVDAYKAKQEHQKLHGGPGPVAEFEIMKIVNEHNGQFEVVFKEE